MTSDSTKSERFTAVLSAVLAVVMLSAGVTAHQARIAPIDNLLQLESDLRFQIEMAFRQDIKERNRRIDQLDATLRNWQDAPPGTENRRRLIVWLEEATRRSMPGSFKPLPDVPDFSATEPEVRDTSPEPRVSRSAAPISAQQEHEVILARTASETQPAVPTEPELELAAETLLPPGEQAVPVGNEAVPELAPEPVETREAVVSLPQPEDVGLPTRAPHVPDSSSPVVHVSGDEPVLPELPGPINLIELGARISGYHDTLNQVELALLRMDTPDLQQLSRQVERLEELTRDWQFITLYYESLSAAERESMAAPRPLDATLIELERQLATAAEGGHDFLGPFDASRREKVTRLQEKVTEIAGSLEH